MSVSTAITNLLEAKADHKHNQEINALGKYQKLSIAKVKICETMLDDEIALVVQKELGSILDKIKELMK
jgi:hypothetical protein